tara:strand:+ start:695 stop:976 length:282 start_codon:yes stop_codon:yes gene_type:complete
MILMETKKTMSDSIKKWHEMQEEKEWTSNSTGYIPKDPIVESVISKFKERSRDGIIKYGTTLQDSPDGFLKFLTHLQEELMDAALYIEKLKQK